MVVVFLVSFAFAFSFAFLIVLNQRLQRLIVSGGAGFPFLILLPV